MMTGNTGFSKTRTTIAACMAVLSIMLIVSLSGCGEVKVVAIQPPDEIVLSWTGNPATTQTISWHGETRYDGLAECNSRRFQATVTEVVKGTYYRYSAQITGLVSGQTYEYRIGDGTTWSKVHKFSTEKNGAFTFMYMGDIQYEIMNRDYKKWGKFIDTAYKNHPNTVFLLQGGDLVVNNGDLKEYEAVMKFGQPMFSSVSVMTTPGNHETVATPDRYKKIFVLPQNGPTGVKEEVYSFDYSNCHVVSMNSNLFSPERINGMGSKKWKTMMNQVDDWLVKDLSSNAGKWKVVFMHQPPYPISENLNLYAKIRKAWVPIFEKYGVDLVFVGHQHIYMRTKPINGVTYIMARSGEKYSRYYKLGDPIPNYVAALKEVKTYELVTVKEKSLSVEAFDGAGNIIDRWSKSK
jgi:acid phosphatase type 7